MASMNDLDRLFRRLARLRAIQPMGAEHLAELAAKKSAVMIDIYELTGTWPVSR